jgi:four helix bundle protein
MTEFKFERLEVWQLSLEYLDLCYTLAERLPKQEEYNLKSQMIRAATSITLNIAEGSTSQSNPEQARFLNMATRSLIETVACRRLIARRGYLGQPTSSAEPSSNSALLRTEQLGHELFAKLQAMRRVLLNGPQSAVRGQPSQSSSPGLPSPGHKP